MFDLREMDRQAESILIQWAGIVYSLARVLGTETKGTYFGVAPGMVC